MREKPGREERLLRWGTVEALPVVHGRLAFASEVRRRLLEAPWDLLALELPPSVRPLVEEAVEALPRVSVVLGRGPERFLEEGTGAWYLPVQPGDAFAEALRVARNERLPVRFVDADLADPEARALSLPDPHGIRSLGLAGWYRMVLPVLERHPPAADDLRREAHMAWRLRRLARGGRRILFVCGMAHWERIRALLEAGGGEACPPEADGLELRILTPLRRSVPFLMGDLPDLVRRYEEHRRGIDLEDFDPAAGVVEILCEARRCYEKEFPGTLERAEPRRLAQVLDFTRRMTVRRGGLIPDAWTLTVAARGVVGHDFARVVLETATAWPWNPGRARRPEHLPMTDARGVVEGEEIPLHNRTPGTAFRVSRLELERRPPERLRRAWRQAWDHERYCSWPPEDVVIEDFREQIARRALGLARIARRRIEEFRGSLLDGLALRETLRDVVRRRIFVREEPRFSGAVGALVLIFEEDDLGERYPWRGIWYAENHNESTLAFYATDPLQEVVGPGVARARYGGILMLYPPDPVPDPWPDLRFERARTPSERLVLAGLYHSREKYVAVLSERPPAPEVRREARRRRKHLLHLPLSTFSTRSLERLRRFHVLNGYEVRGWAARFVR